MSTSTAPITPSQFALAIADLPLSTLALKAAEIRNSIAHLDYSNEELKPFAEADPPDVDCIDAIRENEVVVARMLERIGLLKVEVERRGVRWEELSGEVRKEEEAVEGFGRGVVEDGEEVVDAAEGRADTGRNPWTDGTFSTGRIVNGEVRMDGETAGVNGAETNGSATDAAATNSVTANGVNGTSSGSRGGRLSDEALRRAMEEQMRNLGHDDGDDDGGMHL